MYELYEVLEGLCLPSASIRLGLAAQIDRDQGEDGIVGESAGAGCCHEGFPKGPIEERSSA